MRRGLWIVLALGVFLASVYLLLTPTPPEPPVARGSIVRFLYHKAGHVALFAALAFTGRRAARIGPASTWFAASAYGVLVEILQTHIPGRSGEISDVVIDALAALTAFVPMSPLPPPRRHDEGASEPRPPSVPPR